VETIRPSSHENQTVINSIPGASEKKLVSHTRRAKEKDPLFSKFILPTALNLKAIIVQTGKISGRVVWFFGISQHHAFFRVVGSKIGASNVQALQREAPKAARIRQLRAKGDGILKIGRTLGIGTRLCSGW
jgi:hypothetical protein